MNVGIVDDNLCNCPDQSVTHGFTRIARPYRELRTLVKEKRRNIQKAGSDPCICHGCVLCCCHFILACRQYSVTVPLSWHVRKEKPHENCTFLSQLKLNMLTLNKAHDEEEDYFQFVAKTNKSYSRTNSQSNEQLLYNRAVGRLSCVLCSH